MRAAVDCEVDGRVAAAARAHSEGVKDGRETIPNAKWSSPLVAPRIDLGPTAGPLDGGTLTWRHAATSRSRRDRIPSRNLKIQRSRLTTS